MVPPTPAGLYLVSMMALLKYHYQPVTTGSFLLQSSKKFLLPLPLLTDIWMLSGENTLILLSLFQSLDISVLIMNLIGVALFLYCRSRSRKVIESMSIQFKIQIEVSLRVSYCTNLLKKHLWLYYERALIHIFVICLLHYFSWKGQHSKVLLKLDILERF